MAEGARAEQAESEEPIAVDLPRWSPSEILFHRWFARRPQAYAVAAVAFTLAPDGAADGALRAAVEHQDTDVLRDLLSDTTFGGWPRPKVVDLCAGVGTLAAAASSLGCDATAVELHSVPHLLCRLVYEYSVTTRQASASGTLGSSHRSRQPAAMNADTDHGGHAWQGLATELSDAVDGVLVSIGAQLGWALDEDLAVTIWARCFPCNACSMVVPLVSEPLLAKPPYSKGQAVQALRLAANTEGLPVALLASDDNAEIPPVVRQGMMTCPWCGATSGGVRPSETALVMPLVEGRRVSVGYPLEWRPVQAAGPVPLNEATSFETREREGLRSESVKSSDAGEPTALPIAQPSALWCHIGGRPRTVGEVLLPSQQRYLIAASMAIREAEERLRSRSILSRSQRDAVLTALSLLLTSHSTSVSSLATWDPRRQQIASPEQRTTRVIPALFAEAGPATIRGWWRASLIRLVEHMERSAARATPVHARLADAAYTGLPTSCADAVVWDPPHYDNIDYADLSRPYDLVLAGLPTPKANSAPAQVHGETSRQRVSFDVQRYEAELSTQAEEMVRLLRPNARVGVLWTARDAGDLQSFLNIIASSGVELQQAVRLGERARTGVVLTSPNAEPPPVTYLLVLRQIASAARRSRSQIDAGRVLHLADTGAPALYEGLARILLDHWDELETKRHLSATQHPAAALMATEYVASHPAPADLLLELGRPALLRVLGELGGNQMAAASPDVHAVPHAVLRLLGFSVASSGGFSIPSALRRAHHASERLRRSTGLQDARETTLTIATEVERILRFASVTWAHLIADDWTMPISEIVAKSSSKTFRDLHSMAFGDWKTVFCQLPGRLRSLPQRGAIFDVVATTVRKQKTDEHLSAIVRVRNAVVHDDAEYFNRPQSNLVRDMHAACSRAINVLSQLYQAQVLPMTLQPQEERRDRYGRRLLTLTDTDGMAVEVFVARETDMSQSLIYVASGVNMRDVAPILLSAHTVEAALGRDGHPK